MSLLLLGEFTLRAFLNGRLDLSQAENVARLIAAKSVAAADAALQGIQVCLTRRCFSILLYHRHHVWCKTWLVASDDRVVFLLLFDL